MPGTWMKRRTAVAAGSLAIIAGGLVVAGCGESTSTDTAGAGITVAADGTATLPLRDGGDYTVTMAKGQTTPVDVFANTGGEPVSMWNGAQGEAEGTVGAPFAIELPENASTGYSWKATGGTAPGTVVELVQDWVLPGDKGPGSPGTHYWVYRGTAEGSGTIEFQEFPPGKDTASKTQTVKVTVTKS